MRSELEHNNAREVFFHSLRLRHQARTLIANVTLLNDSTTLQVFDPGIVDRTITLPSMERGRIFIITHSGTTNLLNVVDHAAAPICVLQATETMWLFCTGNEWVSTPDVMVGSGSTAKGGLVPRPPLVSGVLKYLCEDGTWRDPGFVGDHAYSNVTDGTTVASAAGADTLWFRTANNRLSVVVGSNDGTFGDNVLFTLNEANIVLSNLSGYVADQHVAHSGVSINTAANSGLAGGGTIAASRSLTLDVNNLTIDTAVLGDSVPFYDLSGLDTNKTTWTQINAIFDHNVLINYVSDQHVAHSGVSISGGAGLVGGGTIAASRTISLDITGQDAQTPAAADEIIYWSVAGLDFDKCTFTVLNGVLDHNALLNYVAAQHKTHPVSTPNAIAKYTGAAGDLANSGVLIDASNNVTGIAALSATTIELGAVSDTTISRTGAGAIAVEGVQVHLNSISNPLTASQLEVGNASDTTITRSSAGVIAVEGVPLFSNIPQNSQSAAYTLVLADAQKHIFHPSADTTARIWTIPANASVAFPIGTAVTFVNQNAGGVITISITTDTMRLAGPGTTGSRTLAANGMATALKVTATEWIISGTGLT